MPARSRTQKSSPRATSASCATGSPGKAGVSLAAPRVPLRFVLGGKELRGLRQFCFARRSACWRAGRRREVEQAINGLAGDFPFSGEACVSPPECRQLRLPRHSRHEGLVGDDGDGLGNRAEQGRCGRRAETCVAGVGDLRAADNTGLAFAKAGSQTAAAQAASLCCCGSASTRARFRACVWLEHLLFELVAGFNAELAKRLA